MDPKNILHLPDEILLQILRYVSIKDLKTLKKCCRRLEEVAGDRNLWNVDLRKTLITKNQLSYVYDILDRSMIKLAICGDFRKGKEEDSLSLNFIRAVHRTCTQLKELIIEDYYINEAELFVYYFPRTIEKLSLLGCVFVPTLPSDNYRLFSTIHFTNPNLKCLIMTDNCWPLSDILKDISALNHLTELRLNNCSRILSFDLNGVEFNTLKSLDLRNTLVQQKQLEMFCRAQTLKHLFLQLPIYLKEISNASVRELGHFIENRMRLISLLEDHVKRFITDVHLNLHHHRMEQFLANNDYVRANEQITLMFAEYQLNFTRLLLSDSFRNIEMLEVRYCPFTTKEMNMLISRAPKLQYLNIKGTDVTIEDVQHFRSRRPDVIIVSSFDI